MQKKNSKKFDQSRSLKKSGIISKMKNRKKNIFYDNLVIYGAGFAGKKIAKNN